jgi:nucleoside-diphosphate-sugar epimerase
MVETVLVTGGGGFVASWCVVALLNKGYAVRATLRDLDKAPAVLGMVEAAGAPTQRLSFVGANLTRDTGWNAAAEGCAYILHVASPLTSGEATHDRDAFVAPARDGTLRVLNAAVKAGVRRVVMTSAAATARPPLKSGRASDETVWADPDDPQFDAYRRSKILAERAAWDFMNDHGEATEFATVLPGAVFGPVLTRDRPGSVAIIQGLLNGRSRGVPRLGLAIVDVRDLADLHLRAMTAPEAAGQRFIAVGEFLWMKDVAKILRERLGSRAARVPTRELPDFVVRLLALFTPRMRMVVPVLGVRTQPDNAKARRLLGFVPRPAADTLVDCAESLLADR